MKTLCLSNNYVRQKKSQEFRFFKKKIDKTRNYFIEEIKQNDLMS